MEEKRLNEKITNNSYSFHNFRVDIGRYPFIRGMWLKSVERNGKTRKQTKFLHTSYAYKHTHTRLKHEEKAKKSTHKNEEIVMARVIWLLIQLRCVCGKL